MGLASLTGSQNAGPTKFACQSAPVRRTGDSDCHVAGKGDKALKSRFDKWDWGLVTILTTFTLTFATGPAQAHMPDAAIASGTSSPAVTATTPATDPASPAVASSDPTRAPTSPAHPGTEHPGRVVRFGVYQNQPKVFLDEHGVGAGFFTEMLGDIAVRNDWTIQEVPCDWNDCLNAVDQDRIDLMPDVAWSPERAARFDFHTIPVLESWSQIYCRQGRYPQTLEDLSGMRVAVLQGSIQHDTFRELSTGFGIDVEIVPTHSLDDAFVAVNDGRADAAIANRFFGDYFFASYGLTKTPVVFQPVNLYFATGRGKNADLLHAIDETVVSQRRTPNSPYYTMLSKWMTGPAVSKIPPIVLWILGGILALLAVFVVAAAILRQQVRSKTAWLAQANAELRDLSQALTKSQSLLKLTQEIALIGGWEWDVRDNRMTWTDDNCRDLGFHTLMSANDSPLGAERLQSEPEAPGSFPQADMDHQLPGSFARADMDRVSAAFIQCAADGTPYDLEATFTPPDGPQMVIRTSARAIRDESNRIVRVIGIFMDITRLKQEEAARARAEEELRVARRMDTIGHLTGGIAHDFNNLLSAVLGYSGLILRRSDTSDIVRRDVTQIQAAGERAANLSHQLLAFGSRKITQPRPISMNSVISGLERMLLRLLGENIVIDVRLAPDAGSVMADQGQMEQVIINLAVNARDAMPDGGNLVISTSSRVLPGPERIDHFELSAGRWLVMTVSDTGIGMDQTTRDRIFEPFFTTKVVGNGSGLGLATVFAIIHQSGGHIQVETAPGHGAAFHIFLPGLDVQAAPQAVQDESRVVPGNATILLVEDDETVRLVLERILLEAGHRVLTAGDGNEALAACTLHSQEIDLILTDIIMPGLSGDEFAATVQMRYPRIPILFMSGYADHRVADNPNLNPETNFISKPFGALELTTRISGMLNKSAPTSLNNDIMSS